jgi:hypothetical protein
MQLVATLLTFDDPWTGERITLLASDATPGSSPE